jgi:DNA-binding PadR family transcriptional regulator
MRAMPMQHAVLALLAHGESHGYEIKANFEDAVGPQWGELNIGHVYQLLDRCVRDGLVTRRHVPQATRPDKRVYRLTQEGERELERWLEAPFVRQSGYRDDFFLKLVAASRLGSDRLRRVLTVQREMYLGELSSLGELKARHRDKPLVRLLIEAAVRHTEANLRIVEDAEAAQSELIAAAEAGAQAADDELAEAGEAKPA